MNINYKQNEVRFFLCIFQVVSQSRIHCKAKGTLWLKLINKSIKYNIMIYWNFVEENLTQMHLLMCNINAHMVHISNLIRFKMVFTS